MRFENGKTPIGIISGAVSAVLTITLFGCSGTTASSSASQSTSSSSSQTSGSSASTNRTVEPIDDNTTDQMFTNKATGEEIAILCIDGEAIMIDSTYLENVPYDDKFEDGHFYKAAADIEYLNGGIAGYVNFPEVRSIDNVREVSPFDLGLPSITDQAYGLVLIGDYADGDILLHKQNWMAVWKDGSWIRDFTNIVKLEDGTVAGVRKGVTKDKVQEGIKNGVLSCDDYFALVPGKTAVQNAGQS